MSGDKRVFILGAGFSKPAGFPLATELTDRVLCELRSKHGKDADIIRFADGIRMIHRWMIQSSKLHALNIEEFYEYAAENAERLRLEQHRENVGREYGETPYAQANDVMTWLANIDDRLLDVLLKYENNADLEPVYRFAKALRPNDAIITFNYDRLVERAIEEKAEYSWSLGFKLEESGTIPLLKMHGSLDWICFRRGQHQDTPDGMVKIFSKQDINRELHETRNIYSADEHEYAYELYRITGNATLYRWINYRNLIQCDHRWGLAGLGPHKRPSLVPGLGVVWEHAREALFHADKIIIIGFSFSPHDRLAQIEFARVGAGRDGYGAKPPRVIVIDPILQKKSRRMARAGRDMIQRIKAVFGPEEPKPIGISHSEFDWNTLDAC